MSLFQFESSLDVIDTLAIKNAHPRDANIKFDPIPHTYTINNDTSIKYTSVTTWIHSHFSQFDGDKIIDKIFVSKQWGPKHKYWGMSKAEILQVWDKNRDESAQAGTNMHYYIECFHNMTPTSPTSSTAATYKDLYEYYKTTNNNLNPNLNPNPKPYQLLKEWEYFINYVKDYSAFVPYRTEWMVYHEELQLSGSIDMVYELPNGNLAIYDWKRAREIIQDDKFNQQSITKCINHIPDTNYWHYTMQLNIYKMILEEKYGKTVDELCLVVLHPNNFNGNYILYPVPFITKEMKLLRKFRLAQLNK